MLDEGIPAKPFTQKKFFSNPEFAIKALPEGAEEMYVCLAQLQQ